MIAASTEAAVFIVDVGEASTHSGGEVAPCLSKDHNDALGHVLASVISYTLHHRMGSAVADREPLPGEAPDEDLAAGGTVEGYVAHDDILFGGECGAFGRIDHDVAPRQALGEIIVGVALQGEGHAIGDECAEALAG